MENPETYPEEAGLVYSSSICNIHWESFIGVQIPVFGYFHGLLHTHCL